MFHREAEVRTLIEVCARRPVAVDRTSPLVIEPGDMASHWGTEGALSLVSYLIASSDDILGLAPI